MVGVLCKMHGAPIFIFKKMSPLGHIVERCGESC